MLGLCYVMILQFNIFSDNFFMIFSELQYDPPTTCTITVGDARFEPGTYMQPILQMINA